MPCIFVDTPPYCAICLDSRKLQCLRDHRHLIVSPEGKKELKHLLEDDINSSERYKTRSGQEQRKNNGY
jgi:hypothetical protein